MFENLFFQILVGCISRVDYGSWYGLIMILGRCTIRDYVYTFFIITFLKEILVIKLGIVSCEFFHIDTLFLNSSPIYHWSLIITSKLISCRLIHHFQLQAAAYLFIKYLVHLIRHIHYDTTLSFLRVNNVVWDINLTFDHESTAIGRIISIKFDIGSELTSMT